MKELLNSSLYFGVTVSIAGYGIGLFLKRKFKWGFLNPLLLAIIFVIIVLQVFGIDYEVYDETAKYLSYLLTPATVCLAIPLYQQIELLKKNLTAVVLGIVAGVFSRVYLEWHICLDLAIRNMLHYSQNQSQQQSELEFRRNSEGLQPLL
jgi:putative effector of murein hydrolase